MRILGVVLAGGGSTRMGRDKALAPLAGRPMIAYVLERLKPQVDDLAIAGGVSIERFAALGVPAFADADRDRLGPLAGLCAGLELARTRGFDAIATAPCDAPFLPLDLVARLAASLGEGAAAAPRTGPRVQPMYGLWRLSAHEPASRLLGLGAGPFALAEALGARFVDFADASAFANVNAPADLAEAERRLAATRPPA